MKKDYIIWTYTYTETSNGVKVLHLLSKELKKRGYNVYLYSEEPYSKGYDYIDKITDEMRKSAVVIYPEVVVGNPLRFQNVARLILYYPGLNGGMKQYHESEVLFTHSPMFYPEIPVLTVPWLDTTIFYDDKSPKTQDCCFVHKGGRFREISETDGLLEINMDYPKTRNELADLLRTTKTLYSYDNCSALLEEAVLCGAEVKIITEDGIEDFHSTYKQDTKNFQQQLDVFIEITQNLDYRGKIERMSFSEFKKYLYACYKYLLFKYIIKNDKKMIKYKSRIRGF